MSEQGNAAGNSTVTGDVVKQLRKEWVNANDQSSKNTIAAKMKPHADQGHGEAIWVYGEMLLEGGDPIAASEYFETAVRLKVPAGFYGMGKIYKGNDDKKAFRYFQEGAELGDLDCMRLAGFGLTTGTGAEKDGIAGMRWLKKAADAGDQLAKLEYALGLIKGDGIAADCRKAIEMLEKLYPDFSAGGRTASLLSLAYMDIDAAASDKWLKLAADEGWELAKKRLAVRKHDEQLASLSELTAGNEHYHFFTQRGTVHNKRVGTRSSTYSTGSGQDLRINTSHTSWQEIDLMDEEGHLFQVSPDNALAISSGAKVEVIYMGKQGADTGWPIKMVEDSGKVWDVNTTESLILNIYPNRSQTRSIFSFLAFLAFFPLLIGIFTPQKEGDFWLAVAFCVPFPVLLMLRSSASNKIKAKNDQIDAHIGKLVSQLKPQS